MIQRALVFSLLLIGAFGDLSAQVPNDECTGAIMLPRVDKYCSDKGEYDISDATPSGLAGPACWRNGERSHDVWFSFVATKTSARVTVIGRNTINNPGGTLNEPEIAWYTVTNCTNFNLLRCETDIGGNGIVEVFRSQLIIGETYYIRVDARANNTGTFQICIDQNNPPIEAEADCIRGAILCDKESILVPKTEGEGNDPNEMNDACFGGNGEFDSKWFKWTCRTAGALEFTITPNNEPDDIDFIVIELPNGLADCTDRILLRCMASGAGGDQSSPCYGPTGLRAGESDISEMFNCPAGQNNFIAPLDMEVGKSYALGISNFSQTGSGYTIDFGGTGEFVGPDPDFIVNPQSGLKCDEEFEVTDISNFAVGQITGWEWNFGQGAMPQMDTTQGPHRITYNSFGPKSISLTITTDLGCVVTVVKDIFVEPCCEDLEDLVVQRDSVYNLRCGGIPEGAIFVSSTGGSPDYKYSIDGGPFVSPGSFTDLDAGIYEVIAQDIKGCEDTIMVEVVEPDPLFVDAGQDQTIKLGDCTFITGRTSPVGRLVGHNWTGGGLGDIMCDTCSRTKVLPTMGTTTYVITVRDSMGCIATDSVTIFVEEVRPYYAPNAISTNGDGLNDIFTIYGGNGLKAIITLEVYDRWGELVYKGENFPQGDEGIDLGFGWNGYFHDEPMMPAVFVFRADLQYIDDVIITVTGDFTILR